MTTLLSFPATLVEVCFRSYSPGGGNGSSVSAVTAAAAGEWGSGGGGHQVKILDQYSMAKVTWIFTYRTGWM